MRIYPIKSIRNTKNDDIIHFIVQFRYIFDGWKSAYLISEIWNLNGIRQQMSEIWIMQNESRKLLLLLVSLICIFIFGIKCEKYKVVSFRHTNCILLLIITIFNFKIYYHQNHPLYLYLYFCSSVTLTSAASLTPSIFGGICICLNIFYTYT